MKPFLYRIANHFFKLYDKEVSSFTFVFPNRRAGVFFRKYLSQIAEKPIFSPQILAVEECFFEASEKSVIDKISLLLRLFKIYKQISKSEETFDQFGFWGEMLLSDFNEVDKYRVDAEQLFTNIKELKDIDSVFDYFTENQLVTIRQFWSSFVPDSDKIAQSDFLATWEILFPIYHELQTALISENLAYEGMIFREVTDKLLRKEPIPFYQNKKFVFIGFNALNPCEKILMSELKKQYYADFYWDYESDEVNDLDNPASLFINENKLIFPSENYIEKNIRNLKNGNINLISVSSAVGQAKQVNQILNRLYPEKTTSEMLLNTAVVLPDENLLLPLLYSVPEQIDKINVTMGYPLHLTPIAGLIEHIFELFKRKKNAGFYYQTVMNILNHQFIVSNCKDGLLKTLREKINRFNLIYVESDFFTSDKLLKKIFRTDVGAQNLIDYLIGILKDFMTELYLHNGNEKNNLESGYLYQYYISISRLSDVLKEQASSIEIGYDMLVKMIRQLTSGINVPFVGEPVNGLQIMGMLETRSLDFKNIIINSFNEGIFPKKNSPNSFIPYHLRKGFGLPTYEHQDAITSYNFYRLLQRAENVYLLTDSRIDNGNTGEVSRFLHQLKYHYKVNIIETNVAFEISLHEPDLIIINKDSRIISLLEKYKAGDSNALSASSINTFVNCPLQFYFSYIEEIKQTDEVSDQMESSTFGTIFHDVMTKLYEPFTNRSIDSDIIDKIITNKNFIIELIKNAFNKHYFKKDIYNQIELEGNNLLISRILLKYVTGILQFDKKRTPFTYAGGEIKVEGEIPTYHGKIRLKGFIDRIEIKDDKTYIFDYKTGNGNAEFNAITELFENNQDKDKKTSHVFQTFLYAFLYKQAFNSVNITPGLFYIRKIFNDNFNTSITDKTSKSIVELFENYEEEYVEGLKMIIEKIFDPLTPFVQTEDEKNCKFCEFKMICNR